MERIAYLFKDIEWFFVLCLLWVLLNLAFTRRCFQEMLKMINWLVKQQGLNGAITGTETAYQHFRRDMWILFVLIFLIIILIEML